MSRSEVYRAVCGLSEVLRELCGMIAVLTSFEVCHTYEGPEKDTLTELVPKNM